MLDHLKIKHNFVASGLFLSVFFGVMIGCSSVDDSARYSGGAVSLAGNSNEGGLQNVGKRHEEFPWELMWQEGRTVRGEQVNNLLLLEGDRLLAHTDRKGALDAYLKASNQGLTAVEREAAVYRIASLQLSQNQADLALKTISEYFRSSGKAVEDVSAEFSLLFGYAYGQHHDLDQALAWLSRARATSKAQGRFSFAAQEEVYDLLKSVPENKLGDLSTLWDADTFIRSSISEERRRRERGGEGLPQNNQTASVATTLAPGEVRLGVLLPIEGRFAALGRNARNGIELAVAGQGASTQVKLSVVNTGDSSPEAVTAAQSLISTTGPSMVLGPLVSEQASSVRQVLEGARIPSISFSKRGDFSPGLSTFRMGVTAETQIDSLLVAVHDRLGITKLALINSEDPALQENANQFRRKVREMGMNIVYENTLQPTDPSGAVAIATELEKQEIEGIFFVDNPALAATIYEALTPDFRKEVRPLAIANWDNAAQLARSRNALRGAVFVSPFYAQSSRPIIAEFVSSYKARYQQVPDFLAAQGFDAATLTLQAARIAQSSQKSFVDALRGIDVYEGLTGRVYVGADGELRRSFAVLELGAEGTTELGMAAPEAHDPVVAPPVEKAPNTIAPPPPDAEEAHPHKS